MYLAIFCTILLFQLLHCSSVQSAGCAITLPKDIPKFEPIILISNNGAYELFKPTGHVTTLPVNTKLWLVCAGNKNVINTLGVAELKLTCKSKNVLVSADNVQHSLSDLGCKSIPSSTLRCTSQKCANEQGFIFEAGFSYGTDKIFVPSFTICYDNSTEHTFYTKNILNGAAMKYAIQESTRRPFSAEGMKLSTTKVNNYYKVNNQIAVFNNLFGQDQTYVTSKLFLSRGHLTPDADFIFSYEQLATYYYANAAHEFQVVNAGNWVRVENLARSLAAQIGRDLISYNGYIDQLALPDINNNLVDVYLDKNGEFPVPEFYFKALKDVEKDVAIVFVTLNNPYASTVNQFCTNICTSTGLNNALFADFSRGYTFCCALDDFKQYYDDLPADLKASGVLTSSIA